MDEAGARLMPNQRGLVATRPRLLE